MQEDIFLYLFIYVFLSQRGVNPPAELINAVSVLRPLWVNAATRPEENQIVWPPNQIIYLILQLMGQN